MPAIPTNDDVLRLLDRLEDGVADDLESQYLDFKPWRDVKQDLKVAVEYAVCFANAEGGVVVFGVADRTRGRANAIHGARGYDIDVWRRGIYDSTLPHLDAEVDEVPVPEGTGKLLVVRVRRGVDPPYGTARGLYQRRVGKNCMPLDPQSFARTQIESGAVDWSGQKARGVTVDDLDPMEIVRARRILKSRHPQAALSELDDTAFLAGLGALRDGQVTNAGLLLFGSEPLLAVRCPQHHVRYAYLTSEVDVVRNESYRSGLLDVLDQVERIFSGPVNPEKELLIGFAMMRIPAFPVDAVREALLNAVTHRDYAQPDEVLIRHKPTELAIVSPGGFLSDITPENILKHEAVTRNPTLAEAFLKLRLVEKIGAGRQRIFRPVLEYGKPAPVYETDGHRVILRLGNGKADTRMARLLARWREEDREYNLDDLLLLSRLKTGAAIDVEGAARLLQVRPAEARALLERRARTPSAFLIEHRVGEEIAYRLIPELLRHLVDPDAVDAGDLEVLLEVLASSPTPELARRVLDVFLAREPTAEETDRLRRFLESEGGHALENAAPRVYAALTNAVG